MKKLQNLNAVELAKALPGLFEPLGKGELRIEHSDSRRGNFETFSRVCGSRIELKGVRRYVRTVWTPQRMLAMG